MLPRANRRRGAVHADVWEVYELKAATRPQTGQRLRLTRRVSKPVTRLSRISASNKASGDFIAVSDQLVALYSTVDFTAKQGRTTSALIGCYRYVGAGLSG
jgi:hypothetical protein